MKPFTHNFLRLRPHQLISLWDTRKIYVLAEKA